jgi:hypothetical protein
MITDTEIKTTAFRALVAALGDVQAEKFIALIQREPFDYTKWQQTLWPDRSIDEISQAAMKQRQAEKKDESKIGNIEKIMLGVDSQLKFKVDAALTDLRNYWDHWNEEDRQAFKAWVTKLADIGKDMPEVIPYIFLRLEFCEQVGEEEYHTFAPPIQTIKKALDCWVRGEPFTPNSLDDLCD